MDMQTDKDSQDNRSKLSRGRREELHELRTKVHRYLKDRELYSRCEVEVKQRGQWYEFHGHVGSPGIKSVLFGLVPRQNGAQHIVDHLRMGEQPS